MNAPDRLPPVPKRLPLSVDNFLLLNDSGAFDGYAKSELIDGEVYVINAQHHPHARAKSRLLVALANKLREIGSDLEVISEVAVRVNDVSMPEPDVILTAWSGRGAVPVESVALIIEVSDSTLDRDLGRKSDLYAAAGVPEYWVVDLNERRVLMHESPEPGGYRGQFDVAIGGRLISATIEGLEVDSARLLD